MIESKLDAAQVIKKVFNEETNRIRTDTEVSAVISDVDVIIDSTSGDNIAISDGTDTLGINASGSINVESLGVNPQGQSEQFAVSGIDIGNSTSTPLAGGATFTGTFFDVTQYECISITAKADVDSLTDGFKIQFSSDGVTVLREQVTTYLASAGAVFASFPPEAKYFRFVYINAGTPQSSFTIQVKVHTSTLSAQNVPIGYPLKDTYSAQIQRSVLTGKTIDGTYVNLRSPGVSAENSSSTLLGAGETFTGTYQDVLGFSSITVHYYSDQSSAIDGLIFEYSSDGITTHSSEAYTAAANYGHSHVLGINTRYFRVRYINGATPQTAFSLQTIYHIHAPVPHSHKIDEPITGEHGAQLSKSIITGKNPDGTFVNESSSGVISSNSTDTPLGIAGVFTGDYFDSSGYAAVSVACYTDQVGTITIETSNDGINILRTSTANILANTPFYRAETPVGKYIRMTFTNTSGIAQTFLRLQTLAKIVPTSATAIFISTPLTSNSVALNSRSILAGEQENGIFGNVGLSNTSSVKVAITDRPSEVRNRVKVEKQIFNVSLTAANTLIHTVTPGKMLYMESFIASYINNANAIGEWRLRDSTTDKMGFLVGEKVLGGVSPGGATSPPLPEPIPFTTSVTVNEISGDIQLSFYFIGYEE